MKNVKRNLVVSLFSFLMFLMMNIELSGMSGCTADDPGNVYQPALLELLVVWDIVQIVLKVLIKGGLTVVMVICHAL